MVCDHSERGSPVLRLLGRGRAVSRGGNRARRDRGRGAARDPGERAGRGRDHAHSRPRRRTGHRFLDFGRNLARSGFDSSRPASKHRGHRGRKLRLRPSEAELLHLVLLRRVRQGRARGRRRRGASGRERPGRPGGARRRAARSSAGGAAHLRRDRRPARDRALFPGR